MAALEVGVFGHKLCGSVFIRSSVDQTCNHLALPTHARQGTEAADMEMDQGFRVDALRVGLTDINLSSPFQSFYIVSLYLTCLDFRKLQD